MSDKSLYFCGSIRGGIQDAAIYHTLIEHIKRRAPVLTEHVGNPPATTELESRMTDEQIWQTDMAWLRASTAVIAECTVTSMGVGYELGIAESLHKPILALMRLPPGTDTADSPANRARFSAMVTGNPHVALRFYVDVPQACAAIDEFLDTVL
ncbi:nucleoside 2-deoxyribosyltransferase [Entophlyctis helioformis]|nr:nucleoside 2-deoxyribosyltransferase [Entophlyctis helioformis]